MRKTPATTRAARTQSASQQRREQERRDLRDLILKAAGEEFLEKGYDTFSLRRVAERIGYTPTTIYLHFQSKDDLLLATVQDGFEAFDKRMEQTAAAHPDPIKRIEALGRAYIEFGLQNPALYRLMFMQRSDFYFMPRFIENDHIENDGIETDHIADEQIENDPGKKGQVAQSEGQSSKTGKARQKADASTANSKSSQASAVAEHAVGERPRTVAMALLVAAIKDGIASGVVKPEEPIIAADVLWSGAHGLVSLAISPLMSPEHARKVIDSLLVTLISGVRLR